MPSSLLNVVSLVTLFHPTEDVRGNIIALANQVTIVILIDNTPNVDNSSIFFDLVKCIYVKNNSNLGLSKAFNSVMSLDVVKFSDFLLFMDQDSCIPSGHLTALLSDYELLSKRHKVGCIGPVYFDTNTSKFIVNADREYIGENTSSVKTIITSSMLTTYNALRDVNFWNDSIFLDLADWDLCWRLRARGYLVILTSSTRLTHTLGKSVKRVFGVNFRYNSSLRLYYSVRDSIKIIFKSYVPLKYKIRFLISMTVLPFVQLILFPNKKMRLRHLLKAYYHGVKGIDGDIQ